MLLALVVGILRAHDDDHLVASLDYVDQLDVRAPASERILHELQRLGAVLASAGRIAAVPLDVRIKHLRDHLEVTAEHRVKAATGDLGIAFRHGPIIPPSHRISDVGCKASDIGTQNIQRLHVARYSRATAAARNCSSAGLGWSSASSSSPPIAAEMSQYGW